MRRLLHLVLALSLCASPIACGAGRAGPSAAGAGEKVYVLGIEGMMCDRSCPAKVKESLAGITGVRDVQVDFEHKRAVVRADPGTELTAQQIDKSFRNQGYFVSSLEVDAGK